MTSHARPRIFGLGAAKTGTHSLGLMFKERARTAHEQDAEWLIRLHLRRDRLGDARLLRRMLALRDGLRRLRIDSSQVNLYLIPDLLALFPDSKFIMTGRTPVEWLRSIIDDSLRRKVSPTWLRFRDYRFGPRDGFSPQEAALSERGLYPLRGYLGYWRQAMSLPAQQIPSERLLFVKTEELHGRSAEIAEYCGIAGGAVPAEDAKAFANPQRFGVVEALDPSYLSELIAAECGEAVRRYFPDYDIAQAVDRLIAAGAAR